MKFLKNELISKSSPVFPIVVPGKEKRDEKGKIIPPQKICDIKVYLDQLDSTTQSRVLTKHVQAKDVAQRIDFVVWVLRNILTKVKINNKAFTRINEKDETRTLRYIADNTDLSDDESTAIFFAIGQLTANAVVMVDEDRKKSQPLQ